MGPNCNSIDAIAQLVALTVDFQIEGPQFESHTGQLVIFQTFNLQVVGWNSTQSAARLGHFRFFYQVYNICNIDIYSNYKFENIFWKA